MENIEINKAKMKFWHKVMIALCLIAILFSLLNISSSFATALVSKASVKSNYVTFLSASVDERVRVAFPGGGAVTLTHDLGVNLGMESAAM